MSAALEVEHIPTDALPTDAQNPGVRDDLISSGATIDPEHLQLPDDPEDRQAVIAQVTKEQKRAKEAASAELKEEALALAETVEPYTEGLRRGQSYTVIVDPESNPVDAARQKELEYWASQEPEWLARSQQANPNYTLTMHFQAWFKESHPEHAWASEVDNKIGFRTIRQLDIYLGRTDKLLPEEEFQQLLLTKSAGGMSFEQLKAAYDNADGTFDIGYVAAKEESAGDPNAVNPSDGGFYSIGKHQFNSGGTLQNFIRVSGWADRPDGFAGLDPNRDRDAFINRWREITNGPLGEEFGRDQHRFLVATHYEPQRAKLEAIGVDVSGSRAMQEMAYATGVQYGPNSDIMVRALQGLPVSSMNDEGIIRAVYDYKIRTVPSYFPRQNARVQNYLVTGRFQTEPAELIRLARSERQPPSDSSGVPMS